MSVQLTREQQAVVDDRGGRLLVSAAAGSGKTRVLVERLFSRVLGEERAIVTAIPTFILSRLMPSPPFFCLATVYAPKIKR